MGEILDEMFVRFDLLRDRAIVMLESMEGLESADKQPAVAVLNKLALELQVALTRLEDFRRQLQDEVHRG